MQRMETMLVGGVGVWKGYGLVAAPDWPCLGGAGPGGYLESQPVGPDDGHGVPTPRLLLQPLQLPTCLWEDGRER